MKKLTRAEFKKLEKEEKEAYLLDLVENNMKREHASHLDSYHDDDKGVYILSSEGDKEYVHFYNDK